jgi:DNA-binding NtrC family response regulator
MENTHLQMLYDSSQSPAMKQVLKSITRIASSDLGILLVGEFGTGKEWLARIIHQMGPRQGKIFLSLDCTSLRPDKVEQEIFGQELFTKRGVLLQEGVVEKVDGGTMFFDGFSRLPSEIQMKIARTVGHQKFRRVGGKRELWFNGRVIVTISRIPEENTPESILLMDVLHRLSPLVINLPPLRDRTEDIPFFINLFILESNRRHKMRVPGIDSDALHSCIEYRWPGNIRELRNTIEYSVMMATNRLINPEDLPPQVMKRDKAEPTTDAYDSKKNSPVTERTLIENAVLGSQSRKEAAKLLGISVKKLYDKIEFYHLENLKEPNIGFAGTGEDEKNSEKNRVKASKQASDKN